MMRRDYASLLKVDTNSVEHYRIRFSSLVSDKLLNGIKYVYLHKTDKFIIVVPLTDEWKAENNKYAISLYRSEYERAAYISMTGLVKQHGWLPRELFGKRYRVKRDKKGKIYICLNEVISDE